MRLIGTFSFRANIYSAAAILRHLNPQFTYMETVYFSTSIIPKKLIPQIEIRQQLQRVLDFKSVKVQVSRVKNTLTVVISRK